MTIIQNFLTIPISIDPNNKRISLVHDVLKDKKITAIYLMGSNFEFPIVSPYNNIDLSPIGSIIGAEDLYLNIVDINGDHCVKDLSFNFNNFAMVPGSEFNKYEINKVIDIYKSYISFNITNSLDIRNLLLLVIYQSENYTQVNDEVNGCFSIQIKPTSIIENILLKNLVGDRLNGKKIKRIICSNPNFDNLAYLDIYTKCGKRIENLPTSLLRENGPQTFYFDNIEIDWDKSYFKQRGDYSYDEERNQFPFGTITIYKYPTLTFIY